MTCMESFKYFLFSDIISQRKVIFEINTIQFSAINKENLMVSHRFDVNFVFDEVIIRFRVEQVTKQDIQIINTRFVGNINLSLFPVIKLKCTCYRSNERNAYTNIIFLQH